MSSKADYETMCLTLDETESILRRDVEYYRGKFKKEREKLAYQAIQREKKYLRAEKVMITARKNFEKALLQFKKKRDEMVQFLYKNNVPWKVTKCFFYLWVNEDFLEQNSALVGKLDREFGQFKICLEARIKYREARWFFSSLTTPSDYSKDCEDWLSILQGRIAEAEAALQAKIAS